MQKVITMNYRTQTKVSQYYIELQAAGISFSLPKVGYAKALDVWMGVCLIYLFGSLIEFAMVNSLQQIGAAQKSKASAIAISKVKHENGSDPDSSMTSSFGTKLSNKKRKVCAWLCVCFLVVVE